MEEFNLPEPCHKEVVVTDKGVFCVCGKELIMEEVKKTDTKEGVLEDSQILYN